MIFDSVGWVCTFPNRLLQNLIVAVCCEAEQIGRTTVLRNDDYVDDDCATKWWFATRWLVRIPKNDSRLTIALRDGLDTVALCQ